MEDKQTPAKHGPSQNEGAADNYNFVQLNRGYMKEWRLMMRENPRAAELLMFLIEKMGRVNNSVVCSYKILMEIVGASRPTVGRAIKYLKDNKWIDTVKVGNATAYAVNERVAWQAARNQRQYAIFSATIVAGSSEQNSDFMEKSKLDMKSVPIIDFKKERPLVGSDDLPPPDQQDLDLE